MTPLLAEETMPALPWPYVIAVCTALVAPIIVLWRRDVGREADRMAREKEMAVQARSDGVEVTRALAAAAERMGALVTTIEQSDTQRAAIGSDIRAEIENIREKLDDVLDTIEKCTR